MVTIHYVGGSHDGKSLEYRNPYSSWQHCEHMEDAMNIFEGNFWAYDVDGPVMSKYRKVQCERCARRDGRIW